MGDFFVRLLEFGSAIIGYWYVWITGAPFVIDQGLSHKYPPKRFVDFADEWWPPDGRHKILKWICAAGFVVASFQAFDHVNGELKDARTKPAIAANRWEPLSSQEALALRDNWRNIAPVKLGVLCAIPACADLAESIYDTAHDLDWPAIYASTYMNDGIKTGVEIWSYPEVIDTRNKLADAIEHATNGRLKISRHEWPAAPVAADILNGINLVIGRLK
jgi:hypothetical protein